MDKKEEEALGEKKAHRDALHVLPLADMPLQTPGLLNGVMIKNARLESVLEVFRDESAGSGQVGVNDLDEFFPSYKEELTSDQKVLDQLAKLESFDVYALRINLRQLGIDVNSSQALRLSDEKMKELQETMQRFTHALLKNVYGIDADNDDTYAEIFRALDIEQRRDALKKMKEVSDKLNLDLDDLPVFIADCGDLYLSIAYYENSLIGLLPDIKDFLKWMEEINKNSQLRNDKEVRALIKETEKNMQRTISAIKKRLKYFEKSFLDFWNDVNPETYDKLKTNLLSSHADLGAVLCGLTVKMNTFNDDFPTRGGALRKRVEFIRREVSVGLSEMAARK